MRLRRTLQRLHERCLQVIRMKSERPGLALVGYAALRIDHIGSTSVPGLAAKDIVDVQVTVNAGVVDYISKYVLDYARDSWSASVFFPIPLSFEYRQTLNYKRRINGQDYWLLDGRLEHAIGHFIAGIDFTNLLNSQYQEVAGVDMPGRWAILTFRTK